MSSSSDPVNILPLQTKLSTSSMSSTGSSSIGTKGLSSSHTPPDNNASFLSHRVSCPATSHTSRNQASGEPHSGFVFPTVGSPVLPVQGFIPMASSTPSLQTATNTPNNSQIAPANNKSTTAWKGKHRLSLNLVSPILSSSSYFLQSNCSLNKRSNSHGSVFGEDSCEDKERSYKLQRQNYRKEKQRVTEELNTALKDPSIIILSGALKVRGKLKGWTKLWAILKPGLLLLYKSNKIKSSHWVATVLLHCCKIIQRPTKKDGFCFKVFHPLDHSIWATKGPDGETIGAVVQPLPTTYLICRAPSADDGKYWMDGLELALTCSSLLVRTPRSCSDIMEEKSSNEMEVETGHKAGPSVISSAWKYEVSDDEEKNVSDNENDSDTSHVEEVDEDVLLHAEESEEEEVPKLKRRKSSSKRHSSSALVPPKQSNYVIIPEEFSDVKGEQSEELADENKSLLWFLIKQVRPGMDLSRVVLPTFILEPRSFLDKLSDYYYHADYLSRAVGEDDPFLRMKSIVRWYLSGFYKKPKGLKKPYNPVLGETFRCMWTHPNGSKTFYIAEQVSHHPPVSAFYVSNKKDGYAISAAITAKSKFYGNSTSAILDGVANLTLLPRGETYAITMPYANCKGILLGTLSMELGGHVTIACPTTGYTTEMEFKLRSFLSRSDHTNRILGKMKLGRETLATIDGHWDNKIIYKDKRSQEEETLWEVTDEVKAARLTRHTIPMEEQSQNESEKLWTKVSEAIGREDQEAATVEKTFLEEQQRQDVKERVNRNVDWSAKYFSHDGNGWRYRYEDLRPWDERNDIFEYEHDYIIATHRKHDTSVVRTRSLVSVNSNQLSQYDLLRDIPSDKMVPAFHQRESNRQLVDLLRQLLTRQLEQSEQIEQLKEAVASIERKLAKPKEEDPFRMTNTILVVVFAVALQLFVIIFWFGDGKIIPIIKRPPQ